jgi:hypothetical protein
MFRISCITRAINQAMRFARQLLRLPATGQTLCVSTASLLLSYRLEPGLLAQIDSAILVAQVECRVSGPVRLAYLPELLSSWAGPLLHYMAFSVPNAVIIKCDTPTCLRITKRCASSQRIGLQCSQALLYSWCARVPWVCHGKPDGAHRAEFCWRRELSTVCSYSSSQLNSGMSISHLCRAIIGRRLSCSI